MLSNSKMGQELTVPRTISAKLLQQEHDNYLLIHLFIK